MGVNTAHFVPRTTDSADLLVRLAVQEGLSPADVLRHTGVSLEDLADPLVVIEPEQELQVMRNLLSLGVSSSFAFRIGTHYQVSRLGLLGYAFVHSENIRAVFELGVHFFPLTYSYCAITTQARDDEFIVSFHCDLAPAELSDFVVIRDMAAVATLSRELTGHRVPLRRWWLEQRGGFDLPGYERFINGKPEFGREKNIWALDPATLDVRLPLSNPALRAQCVAACESMLERKQCVSRIDGRVRDLLMRSENRILSLEELAGRFHVTTRTLRRRLEEAGTSYRDLANEVRYALAVTMLHDKRLSLNEISDRLGYRNASSFTAAFRRWAGRTPSEFRQQVFVGRQGPVDG